LFGKQIPHIHQTIFRFLQVCGIKISQDILALFSKTDRCVTEVTCKARLSADAPVPVAKSALREKTLPAADYNEGVTS
jgi:hypothetical protein